MTMKYSQGYCEGLVGRQELCIAQSAVIALVDGGASSDTIYSSATGTTSFTTIGFCAGDKIYVRNATASGDNITAVACTAVTASTITLPTGTWNTGQVEGDTDLIILASKGGSYKDLMQDGSLYMFKGTQPTSPDDSCSSGDLLCTFDNVLFGTPTWDAVNLQAYIELTATLSATASATGTATWFRFCQKGGDPYAASTSIIRCDGSVGSSGDLVAVNTSIISGAPQAISSWKIRVKRTPSL